MNTPIAISIPTQVQLKMVKGQGVQPGKLNDPVPDTITPVSI